MFIIAIFYEHTYDYYYSRYILKLFCFIKQSIGFHKNFFNIPIDLARSILLLYLVCLITFRNMLIFSFIYIQHYFLNSPTSSLRSEQTELLPILWIHLVHVYLSRSTHFSSSHYKYPQYISYDCNSLSKETHLTCHSLHGSSNYAVRNNLLIFQITFLGGNFVDKFCQNLKFWSKILIRHYPKVCFPPFFFGFQYLCNISVFTWLQLVFKSLCFSAFPKKSTWQSNWWETKIFFLQKILWLIGQMFYITDPQQTI